MQCTFGDFVPASSADPNPNRPLADYMRQFRDNAHAAGSQLFGTGFRLQTNAIGKVEGDVFELLVAASLWNAAAVWNTFQDTGLWNSTILAQPPNLFATPSRKTAIVKLPRGYDATRLFVDPVRNRIRAHEQALERNQMQLGHSSPDIVAVRLPSTLSAAQREFMNPMNMFTQNSLDLLESAHTALEGTVEANGFLFAMAVKRSTRSDRLYQPLFEANVLKYLVDFVGGGSLRFYVHMETFEGADVERRYRAASLVSLMRGGMVRAIDQVVRVRSPRETAQLILNELPSFPA